MSLHSTWVCQFAFEYSCVGKQELTLEFILGFKNEIYLAKIKWANIQWSLYCPRQLEEVARKCVESG